MSYQIRGARREQNIADMCALLELSGRSGAEVDEVLHIAQASPDVATAVHDIVSLLGVHSEILQDKWHKHISQLWFRSHPTIPSSLNLRIMSHDVMCADALLEAHALLQELEASPAKGLYVEGVYILTSGEEARIASSILLFGGEAAAVRRMCAIVQELRLVRVVKNRLCVVKSRYKKFQALPLSSQYYLLWHIDMYHLDWKEYLPQLGSHMAVFQQYLPMIWEMLERASEGQVHMVEEFSWHVVRAFRPLWQQDIMMGMYEQSVLRDVVEEWLIEKVFIRYGLVEYIHSETRREAKQFAWTRLGSTLLKSERSFKLPCATDVLD